MTYEVYFELYGKKLKTSVEAPSEAAAIQKIKDAIKIHKVVPAKEKQLSPEEQEIFDKLWNIFK